MVRVPAGSAPSRPSPGCRQRRGRARTRSDIYAKTCALQVSLAWGLGKVGEQVRCPFEVSGLKEADGEAFRPMFGEDRIDAFLAGRIGRAAPGGRYGSEAQLNQQAIGRPSCRESEVQYV